MPRMTLLEWRKRHKVAQEAAALEIGVTQSVLSKWERGVTFPSPKNLRKIATYTKGKVTALDFLKGP